MHLIWAGTSVALIAAFVQFGAVAVAIGWSISTALTALFALTRVSHVLDLRTRAIAEAVGPSLLAALGTATLLVLFNHYVLQAHPGENTATWGRLLGELAAGAIIYFGALMLFAGEALAELRRTALMIFRRHESEELTPTD